MDNQETKEEIKEQEIEIETKPLEETPGNQGEKEKKSKKKWLLLLLLLLLLGFAGWFFLKGGGKGFDFDRNAQNYESPIKKPEEWAKDRIAFPAFKEATVGEGDTEINMALSNPDFNDAYFQFFLYLDDKKEEFFKTGIIKPGQAVTKVPLPENLTVGEHKVRLETKTFAPGDPDVKLSGANSFFKLRVLKG